MSKRVRRYHELAILAFAVALPAPAAAQDTGSFEASVKIDGAAVPLAGFAWSEANPAGGGWFAHLLTPGGGSSLMLLYKGEGRPPTGEFPIVDLVGHDFDPPDGQFVATGSLAPQHFSLTGFHSTSGIVVVTSSTPGSVEGTFEFEAKGAMDGTGVTVDGTFTTSNREE